jgi:hypothetical protein
VSPGDGHALFELEVLTAGPCDPDVRYTLVEAAHAETTLWSPTFEADLAEVVSWLWPKPMDVSPLIRGELAEALVGDRVRRPPARAVIDSAVGAVTRPGPRLKPMLGKRKRGWWRSSISTTNAVNSLKYLDRRGEDVKAFARAAGFADRREMEDLLEENLPTHPEILDSPIDPETEEGHDDE